MTLKLRYLFAGVAACSLSMPAGAGPAERYLGKSSSGQAASEKAVIEARFQAWLRDPVRLTIDRKGTIRNGAGRPVGWWGVDGPGLLFECDDAIGPNGYLWGIDGEPCSPSPMR
ncbi:MAG TPA: hypothetical protein VMV10_28655 [Pirellulales bacterium]|nr:hypothetical protein [Pirellulales bacterium]